MPKTNLIFLCAFLLPIAGARTATAQEPPIDSLALGGRIVHVYLPSDDIDSLILRNWNTFAKKNGKYWHTFAFPRTADKYNSNAGFFFSNHPRNNLFLVRPGLGAAEGPIGNRFTVADFQGKNEMWIVVDPSGPITAKPVILLEPPRIVNILNPWESTAPRLVLPYGKKSMVTIPDRCGWFMAFLLDARDTRLHFEEINNTATYGSTRLSTPAVDYDIAAEFVSKAVADTLGTSLWLDTDANAWQPSFPGKIGNCQFMLAATVRDFSAKHPDFDFGALIGDHVVRGVVQNAIGPDPGRKPVLNPANSTQDTAISFSQFDTWWITDSTNANPALRSYESCYDIPMSKNGDGGWEYSSFRDSPDHGFWPVEGEGLNKFNETSSSCYVKPPPDSTNWVTGGPKRNFNFCLESHATFIYQAGQKFDFRGDDDAWVFIDNKLALDLGGVHVPKQATILLDSLGLTPGKAYNWDFFNCDRQPCASTLNIRTTIPFRQQRVLEAVEDPAKAGAFRIIKRTGLAGRCGGRAVDSAQEVPPVGLVYTLLSGSGQVVETLEEGTNHGGILIQGASVALDAALMSGLPAGRYTLSAHETGNSLVRATLGFVVAEKPVSLFKPRSRPASARPKLGRRMHDILGRIFRFQSR